MEVTGLRAAWVGPAEGSMAAGPQARCCEREGRKLGQGLSPSQDAIPGSDASSSRA